MDARSLSAAAIFMSKTRCASVINVKRKTKREDKKERKEKKVKKKRKGRQIKNLKKNGVDIRLACLSRRPTLFLLSFVTFDETY